MPTVDVMSFYLGKSPAAKHASLGRNLMLEDEGFCCRQFRQSLMESQAEATRFRIRIAIPELPPLDVQWIWVGQTAGVAFWIRNRRIGAASIMLNGVECDDEQVAALAALNAHQLTVPRRVRDAIATAPRPMTFCLFYDLYSYTDPVIATAAPALSNALFTLFGTNG